MDILSSLDFTRREAPTTNDDLREHLIDWLGYQRHEFVRKLRDLTPAQMAEWSVPPLELSVLGLVRHMTQMEHGYVTIGLGGGERVFRYGEDDYPGGSADTVDEDLGFYLAEVTRADDAIAAMPSLESMGAGHGWTLAATLIKMIDEYAIHAGQAHMLRFAALGEIKR
jgi:hypothetical protein